MAPIQQQASLAFAAFQRTMGLDMVPEPLRTAALAAPPVRREALGDAGRFAARPPAGADLCERPRS